jgi:hypothetical protein
MSTLMLRRFLSTLGYATYGWELGRNIGPTARVVSKGFHGTIRASIPAWSATKRTKVACAISDAPAIPYEPLSARRIPGEVRAGRASAPCHFQLITHRGACGKARVVPHNRRPGLGIKGNG